MHSVTHAIGAICSIVGLALLMTLGMARGAWTLIGCGLYGVTLILMYTASTVYHALPFTLRRAKLRLQTLDHCAIFLLIAGTYTPFSLLVLGGVSGWTLFAAVWSLAILGIAIRTTGARRMRTGPVLLYLTMGWLVVFVLPPLTRALPPGGLELLAGGGLAYTLGIPFYAWHRLRYHHAIWHGFVLLGSVLHFLAVLLYLMTPGS